MSLSLGIIIMGLGANFFVELTDCFLGYLTALFQLCVKSSIDLYEEGNWKMWEV
jgi:hypothetical protein